LNLKHYPTSFVLDTQNVYCEVRRETLNFVQINYVLQNIKNGTKLLVT
jgi:hypothetical protein